MTSLQAKLQTPHSPQSKGGNSSFVHDQSPLMKINFSLTTHVSSHPFWRWRGCHGIAGLRTRWQWVAHLMPSAHASSPQEHQKCPSHQFPCHASVVHAFQPLTNVESAPKVHSQSLWKREQWNKIKASPKQTISIFSFYFFFLLLLHFTFRFCFVLSFFFPFSHPGTIKKHMGDVIPGCSCKTNMGCHSNALDDKYFTAERKLPSKQVRPGHTPAENVQ